MTHWRYLGMESFIPTDTLAGMSLRTLPNYLHQTDRNWGCLICSTAKKLFWAGWEQHSRLEIEGEDHFRIDRWARELAWAQHYPIASTSWKATNIISLYLQPKVKVFLEYTPQRWSTSSSTIRITTCFRRQVLRVVSCDIIIGSCETINKVSPSDHGPGRWT